MCSLLNISSAFTDAEIRMVSNVRLWVTVWVLQHSLLPYRAVRED